ncbi:unnamed protein product [Agarophyton chilense]
MALSKARHSVARRVMTSRSQSRAAALPLTHDPTPQRTAPTARELRESYHDRLDTEIDHVLTAFQDLVASCQISDRPSNARAEYQTQVEASNLANSADHLLKLIADLKVAVVTQNLAEVKTENRYMQTFMDKNSHEMLTHIVNLGDAIAKTLRLLENNYYASCTTWNHNPSPNPN